MTINQLALDATNAAVDNIGPLSTQGAALIGVVIAENGNDHGSGDEPGFLTTGRRAHTPASGHRARFLEQSIAFPGTPS